MKKAVWTAAVVMFSFALQAAVPQKINFQGRLTDDAGTPVEGIVSIEFTLYDAAAAGTAQWTETQSVAVSEGYLSVQLGSLTPITSAVLTSALSLYLAVNVDGDGEMSPRYELASAAYAIYTDPDSHSHDSLDASDGDPANAVQVDAIGNVHLEGGVNYNTGRTGYLQIPVPAFQIGRSTWWWAPGYDDGYLPAGAPNVYVGMTAPINLPDGARIREVTAYAVDNESSANLTLSVRLRSVNPATGSATAHEDAIFTTTGTSANPQTFTVTVSPVVIVDNATRQYCLWIDFNPGGYQGPNITFNGATICYDVYRIAP